MTTLRVVVDELTDSTPGGKRRYVEDLARQLIAAAPAGCEVEAIVSNISDDQLSEIRQLLPGGAEISRLPLARRELAMAWQSGLPVGGTHGILHAPSLLAPLRRHNRRESGNQIAVTIHDTLAWTHPDALGTAATLWTKAMTKRARKYADAIIVPTHAVADRLAEKFDFGDRVRVIGGAAATTLRLPRDAEARADRLKLPQSYALTLGSPAPRKGIAPLIHALARPEVADLPLVIVGPDRVGDATVADSVAASGLPNSRVRALGSLDDADLAVVFDRATLFVFPSLAEGFGQPLVEAFKFGLPVIHSDDPALVEVSGGAGLAVKRPSSTKSDAANEYSERLATVIGRVLTDTELSTKLSVLSTDRARAFSWRDSAERIWQLHADL
jgi:glycosyltransferase involved in cell wall biosynthesis